MRYIPALDGLRAVAVALVVASHAAHLPAGFLGVDVFFVLSGFLITGLLVIEHRATGRINIVNFYLRRGLRLFPCLWAMVGLVLLSSWLIHAPERFAYDAHESLFALLYIENWALITGASGGSPFQHTWSLAIEEQFYIVWALGLALLLDHSRWPSRTIGLLLAGALALYAVLWLSGAGWMRLFVGSDTRAFELLAGALLGTLYCRGELRPWIETHAAVARLSAIAALIALPLIASVALPPLEGKSLGVQLLTVAATLIIIGDVCANSMSAIGPLLARRVPVYLGSISYGIYLWHDPLSWLAGEYGAPLGFRILIIAGGGVALAALSYRYIERPALALKHRIAFASTRRPPSTPPGTPPAAPSGRRSALV